MTNAGKTARHQNAVLQQRGAVLLQALQRIQGLPVAATISENWYSYSSVAFNAVTLQFVVYNLGG